MTDQNTQDAFTQGKAAATKGEPLIENPFDESLPAYEQWNKLVERARKRWRLRPLCRKMSPRSTIA
ncbi:hypothetical protein [Komagataeibacter kakiaceti]|uniref:hypothetical protein n=1 Tax=Komagataeibacter kakiaceti TaxID=943261 RepID=UPI000A8CC05F|nr:hypothetical protein [Komagataeibacter kakiaceti]